MEIPIFVYSLLILLIPLLTGVIISNLQRFLACQLNMPVLQESTSHLWYLIRTWHRDFVYKRLRNIAFVSAVVFAVCAASLALLVSFVASQGTEIVTYEITTTRFGKIADLGLDLATDYRSFTGENLYERFQTINRQFGQEIAASAPGNKSTFRVLPQKKTNPLSGDPVFPSAIKNVSAMTGAIALSLNLFNIGSASGLNQTKEPHLWYASNPKKIENILATAFRYELVPIAWLKSPLPVFNGLRLLVFGHRLESRSLYLDSIERYVYDEIRCDVEDVRIFQEFRQSMVSMWPASSSRGSSRQSLRESYEIARNKTRSWGLSPPTSSAAEVSRYFNYTDSLQNLLGRYLFWDYYTHRSESTDRRSYVACHFGTAQYTSDKNHVSGNSHYVQCTVDRISVYQREITEREKKNCVKAESKYGKRTDKPILVTSNDTLQSVPYADIRYFDNRVFQKGPLRMYHARLYTKVSQPTGVMQFSSQDPSNFYFSKVTKRNQLNPAKEINITKDMRFERKYTPDWPTLFMGNYSISDTRVKTAIDLSWEGLILIIVLFVVGALCFIFAEWKLPKQFRQSLYLTIHEIKRRQNTTICCPDANTPAAVWDLTLDDFQKIRLQAHFE